MASPSTLFSVAGKNVLVTGGSRGIGLMIAKGYMNAGANVLITSRTEKDCKAAVETIGKTGGPGTVQYLTSNAGSREGCEQLAKETARVFDNRLDVLVNNAGTSWGEPLTSESKKHNWGWDKVFDLNVKGMFYLTRACFPSMKNAAKEGDPARVINIGSIAGFVNQNMPTHAYDVSKAAVHHLTKKLSADFASQNITVNCVAPGFVPSKMSQGLETWGPTKEEMAKAVPLGRMGNEDDMAGACIYFSSRAGAWCTGVIMNVDGGAVGTLQIGMSSL